MMETSGGSTGLLLEILHWLWLPVLLGATIALLTTPDWRRDVAWHTRILAGFTVFAVLGEFTWRWLDPGAVIPLAAWAGSFLVLSLALSALVPRPRRNSAADEIDQREDLMDRPPKADNPFLPETSQAKPWGELAVAQAIEGIAVMDPEGQIVLVNKAWADLHGYKSAEVSGHHVSLFHGPDQLEQVRLRLRKARDSGAWVGNSEQRKKNGETFQVRLSLSCFQGADQDPSGFVAIAHEIDSTVISSPEATSDHEQEAETLRVLVGSVAHEFNNLLTGILGNASLISLQPNVGEEIGEIESAGRRAAELSRLLQAYSGRTHAVVDSLILSDLVKSYLGAMQPNAGGRVAIHFEANDSLPVISVDPVQIRLLLRNLVDNAMEATTTELVNGETGEVVVRTGVVELGRQHLDGMHMGDRKMPGSYVFLEVADSGPGFNEETRTRMFEPFFTTREQRRGLGLPTVQSIVRAHQGVIEIHSEPGQGARLRVFFPTGRPKSSPRGSTARPAGEKTTVDSRTKADSGARGTILVVDNERIILDLATNVLEFHNYEVLTADEGEPALALYRQHGRDIRAVLLDLSMPIMDGEEVFDEIRRMNPRAQIVLMTGHDAEKVRKDFEHRGVAAVLQKPFQTEQLVATLRSILKR